MVYTNSYVRGSTPNKYKINASYNPVARTVATTTDLAWTRRFGDIAPFLQLDLKLLWRNKHERISRHF